MKFDKTISNPSYQELSDRFEKHFDRVENQETVDSIGVYKTTLRIKLEIRNGLNMDFPAKLKLTQKGITTQLNIFLNPTKIIFVALIFGGLLGTVFYLVNNNPLNAGIFGSVSGLVFFLILRSAVSKGLSEYARNLTGVKNAA